MSGDCSPDSHSPGAPHEGNPNRTSEPGTPISVPAVETAQRAAEVPVVLEAVPTDVAEHDLALDFRLEVVLLVAACILPVVVAFLVIFASVDLYFPADGAHAVGDADALLGRGVRDLRHPPLFPLIVAFFALFGTDIAAFQMAFATAMVLLPLGLFVLLRRWFGPVSTFVGTISATFTPVIGELMGWGGGPTLLALDLTLFCLASFEWWIQRGGKRGLLVGTFAGLTALTHPFGFVALVFFLGVRWVALRFMARPIRTEWSPLRWRGILSFAAPLALGFGIAASYYSRVKSLTIQLPDFWQPWNLLVWSFRENVFPIFLILVGVLLPLPLLRRDLFVLVISVAAFFIAIPSIAAWDPSYSSRVAYFLPIVLGSGGACLSLLILETLHARRVRKWQVVAAVAMLLSVATAGAIFGTGYIERVEVASLYYQRLHPVDLPAFEALRSGSGTVATSWEGGLQDEGIVSAWFVEALAKRPALGPGAPWLSTLTDVGPNELDMQRFFSGDFGIENGALQASVSPTGALRDPAIQANINGFYYPLAYINSLANSYPIPVQPGAVPTRVGNTLQYRHTGSGGSGEVLETISLVANSTVITYTLQGANVSAGDWDVWLWPAYFRPWTTVDVLPSGYRTTQLYRDGEATTQPFSVEPATVVRYFEEDPRWGLQAFEFRLLAASSLTIRIAVDGVGPTGGAITGYDEASLINRYDLTNVLLWNDTGWQPRFEATPGYEVVLRTPNLVVYRIAAGNVLSASSVRPPLG